MFVVCSLMKRWLRGSPGVCYLRSARSTDGLTPSFIPNLSLNSYPCVSLRRYRTASRSKHRREVFRCPQSSITWPEGDREVLRSRRGFLVLCSLKMAMAMKPAERLDFGGADRHLGTRGFSGTLSTRVGPPAALSGPTVLPRTKGAPSLAATPWRPWCRRCWSRWRTSGAGSGRRRPAAGAPAAADVGGLGHRRLLLC